MSPLELLSKQLEQYQRQNAREHEVLTIDIDHKHEIILKEIKELSAIMNALHNDRLQDEKKILEIEDRQKEIQEIITQIKEHQMKRSYLWKWIIGAISIGGAVVGLIKKWFVF